MKSIPVNSTGTFNFEDAKEFRFIYNGSVYQVALRSDHQHQHREGGRAACVARVPRHVAHRQPSQADAGHQLYGLRPAPPEPLNFELAAYRAADAQETIAAKRSPISPAAAAAASRVE